MKKTFDPKISSYFLTVQPCQHVVWVILLIYDNLYSQPVRWSYRATQVFSLFFWHPFWSGISSYRFVAWCSTLLFSGRKPSIKSVPISGNNWLAENQANICCRFSTTRANNHRNRRVLTWPRPAHTLAIKDFFFTSLYTPRESLCWVCVNFVQEQWPAANIKARFEVTPTFLILVKFQAFLVQILKRLKN